MENTSPLTLTESNALCDEAENDHAERDPTYGVKRVRYVSKGHHSWTLDEVDAYEAAHPLGTKARLALALLLYTAGRREDIPRLGPKHLVGGRLRFVQAKNEHRSPVEVDIPVHADLAEAIARTPVTGRATFLVTDLGAPFTANGFGNKFKDWCREAGLEHCSAHGCRKATAARLAERGATPHQIMAITGHRTLEEVERYTKAAQRAGLADAAMALLPAKSAREKVPPDRPAGAPVGPKSEKAKSTQGLGKPLALPTGLEPVFSP